jgi:hypothetical protein
MVNEVMVGVETGYFAYPKAIITYDGTNIAKFYRDKYLNKIILDAIIDTGDGNDLYDFASLLFSYINNAVKRRSVGQELVLKSVEVFDEDEQLSVKICR